MSCLESSLLLVLMDFGCAELVPSPSVGGEPTDHPVTGLERLMAGTVNDLGVARVTQPSVSTGELAAQVFDCLWGRW